MKNCIVETPYGIKLSATKVVNPDKPIQLSGKEIFFLLKKNKVKVYEIINGEKIRLTPLNYNSDNNGIEEVFIEDEEDETDIDTEINTKDSQEIKEYPNDAKPLDILKETDESDETVEDETVEDEEATVEDEEATVEDETVEDEEATVEDETVEDETVEDEEATVEDETVEDEEATVEDETKAYNKPVQRKNKNRR